MLGTTTRRIVVGQPAPSERAASASVCRSIDDSAASIARYANGSTSDDVDERQRQRGFAEEVGHPQIHVAQADHDHQRRDRQRQQAQELHHALGPRRPQPHPDHRRHQQHQHRDHGEDREQQRDHDRLIQRIVGDQVRPTPARVRPPAIRLRVEKSAIAYSGKRKNSPNATHSAARNALPPNVRAPSLAATSPCGAPVRCRPPSRGPRRRSSPAPARRRTPTGRAPPHWSARTRISSGTIGLPWLTSAAAVAYAAKALANNSSAEPRNAGVSSGTATSRQ